MATKKLQLLKDWRWAKLGDVCEFIRGVSYKPQESSLEPKSDYLPILRAGNIGDSLNIEDDLVWVTNKNVSKQQRFQIGDIAICMASGSPTVVGKTAQLKQTFDGSVGAFCGIIRSKDDVVSDYISYWFRSQDFLRWRNSQARGANIQNLRFSQFIDLQILLPPLEEQKRIAARLDEQMRHIEQARLAAEESLSAAWELPSAYLQEVFGSNVSNKWIKTQLGEVLKLRKEVIHPYDNPKGPAVFVGLEHIESNTGIRIGFVEVEMSKLTGRKPKYYKGDIVYGYLRPYLNKVWVAEFDGLCSVDQYVYSVDENKADIDFIAWFMRSPIYLKRAPVNGAPGQLPRIRTEEVASVEINLPPLKEQKKIASQISKKLSTTNELISKLETQLAEIESLPSAVLGQAFGGQL